MSDCGVYKYVYNNDEIIYIGMSAVSIPNRIQAHGREEKFQPYLDKCKVYFIHTTSAQEAKGIETLLINKYKPILNVAEVNEFRHSVDIESTLPDWKLYANNIQTERNKKNNKKSKPTHKRLVYDPDELSDFSKENRNVTLAKILKKEYDNGSYVEKEDGKRSDGLYIDVSCHNDEIEGGHILAFYRKDVSNSRAIKERMKGKKQIGDYYVPNLCTEKLDLPKCKGNGELGYYHIPPVCKGSFTWGDFIEELIPFCEEYRTQMEAF